MGTPMSDRLLKNGPVIHQDVRGLFVWELSEVQ